MRALGHTFGLPVLITNCSNNYGPYQFPEKLIPLVHPRARTATAPRLRRRPDIRDWLYVDDHCRAHPYRHRPAPGETYNIGGHSEHTNLQVVQTLSRPRRRSPGLPHARVHAHLITYVNDRPGHDRRYAIDATKIQRELSWQPTHTFETGLANRPVVPRQPGLVATTARQASHRMPRPEEATMEIRKTALDDVVEIRPPTTATTAAWFSETYKQQALLEAGIDIDFVQDNESFSAPVGTLRGLHYQAAPHPQDKLVRAIRGSMLDVAVDISR